MKIYIVFYSMVASLLSFGQGATEDDFSEFGVIRANIAEYCSDHRWLACFEPKHFPESSEVVAFDRDGNIFRVRGDLRPEAENMLSLDSYENPSITFSTKEGYMYVWNAGSGENPFEFPLEGDEYRRIIKKIELYPLLKSSKDGPLSFRLVKSNPDFYDHVISLPRPNSMFQLKSPTARRIKIGIFPANPPGEHGFSVQKVVENSAAAAAGVRPGDRITNLVINGVDYDLKNGFPLPEENFIRIVSARVVRNLEKDQVKSVNINIFPPSPVEYFLLWK